MLEVVQTLTRVKPPRWTGYARRIREHGQPILDELKRAMRASPAVQADETGWREDGENGYILSVSMPTVRYYEYHHSRAGAIVKRLIGEAFQGVLGSDFYAGYNIHEGLHQRCWAHFLRRMRPCSPGPRRSKPSMMRRWPRHSRVPIHI
jgi:Transposase IS66 family